jgi:hypothetical protein
MKDVINSIAKWFGVHENDTEVVVIPTVEIKNALVAAGVPSESVSKETDTIEEVVKLISQASSNARHNAEVRGLLHNDEVGLVLIDIDGVIISTEGGGLEAIGSISSDWNGFNLFQVPEYHAGLNAALAGNSYMAFNISPTLKPRMLVLRYSPRFDGTGHICGITLWWHVVPEGQTFATIMGEFTDE